MSEPIDVRKIIQEIADEYSSEGWAKKLERWRQMIEFVKKAWVEKCEEEQKLREQIDALSVLLDGYQKNGACQRTAFRCSDCHTLEGYRTPDVPEPPHA